MSDSTLTFKKIILLLVVSSILAFIFKTEGCQERPSYAKALDNKKELSV